MSSRSLLLCTCLVAIIATPAHPQTIEAQQTVTKPSLSLAVPQQAILAPNMRAALRKWGLDRQSTQLRFTRRALTSDFADFGAVVSTGKDGKVVTLENLVIRRDRNVGSTFGQFTIEGTNLVGPNGLLVGGFSLVGVRGGDSLAGLINDVGSIRTTSALSGQPSAQPRSPMLVDRLTMRDFVTQRGLITNPTSVSIGEIVLSNLMLTDNTARFEGVAVKNIVYGSAGSELKLGSFQLGGLGPSIFALLERSQDDAAAPFDVSQLTLGSLTLADLSVTLKTIGSSPARLNSFSLKALSIGNITQGFVKHVRLSGVTLTGAAGRQPWQLALTRVGMTEINLGYLSEVAAYVRATIKTALAGPNKAGTELASARPRRVLKDLLPGGPLDGGFSSFDLAELNVAGGGFTFDIDQIGFNQERNAQGIITRADFVPTKMRLAWPQLQGSGGNPIAAMMSGVGTSEIIARFSVASSFEPTTDILRLESYRFEIQDWGSLNLGFTMSGLNAFMAKTSFSDFEQLASTSEAGSVNKPRAALTEMLRLYRDLTINAAQVEIADLGGINKFARLTGGSATRRSSATPSVMTQDQVRETRLGWAQKPRALAGDKTKPALERSLNIAFARWIENGGSVTIAMAPSTPIGMSEFNATNSLNAERLGLAITNQTPPAP